VAEASLQPSTVYASHRALSLAWVDGFGVSI
jgi:hypothetical protein